MGPALSIIVPIYNKDAYLGDCLRSILNQSFTNFELILVNDGSTDTSGKICHEYKSFDKRIIVIDQHNAGVSAARNTGLKRANGIYVGFVDSDDTIEPDMYQLLMNNASFYDADVSVCRLRTIFPHKNVNAKETAKTKLLNHDEALSTCLRGDLDRSANNKIYKLDLIRNMRFVGHIYEDVLFTCKVFLTANKTVLQNVVKYNYIIRDGSASMRPFNTNYLETVDVSAEIVRLIETNNKTCLKEARVFDVITNLSLLNLLLLKGINHYPIEYLKIVKNLTSYRLLINSNALPIKHIYAWKLFNISPQLYARLLYWYGLLTNAEIIKRTRKDMSAASNVTQTGV